MTRSDYEYRETHAVVPQLDFSAYKDPFSLFEKPPVEHTIYASMENAKVMDASTAAGIITGMAKAGIGGALLGGSDGFGMAADIIGTAGKKISESIVKAIDNKNICQEVIDCIKEEEEKAWPMLNFARTFQPADGYLGDIILERPAPIFSYEGNGHQFFDNGNYFEGYFRNGKPCMGIFIYRNGARYVGGFDANGFYSGVGLLLNPDGTYYYGVFQNGKQAVGGLAVYASCAYYGEWDMGIWHGDGWLRTVDGSCFLGRFDNGESIN